MNAFRRTFHVILRHLPWYTPKWIAKLQNVHNLKIAAYINEIKNLETMIDDCQKSQVKFKKERDDAVARATHFQRCYVGDLDSLINDSVKAKIRKLIRFLDDKEIESVTFTRNILAFATVPKISLTRDVMTRKRILRVQLGYTLADDCPPEYVVKELMRNFEDEILQEFAKQSVMYSRNSQSLPV